MDERGQVYFGPDGEIPDEDHKRYLDALREEQAMIEAKMRARLEALSAGRRAVEKHGEALRRLAR